MSDRVSEWIHAITGRLRQVPTGECPYVGIVPDDYLPPEQDIGIFGIAMGAGGVGTRSEIALTLISLQLTEGIEISELWVTAGTTGSTIEIIVPAALSGFTVASNFASDLGHLLSRFRAQSNNTGAASATDRILVEHIFVVLGNEYVRVPGRWILRRGRNPGAPETEAILIRATTDQVVLRVMGVWRALDKRSL